MIDKDINIYLIEVNVNPWLSITSKFSSVFINKLIDNVIRLSK